ncbi:MAG: hypothetical protein O2913_05960 [Chloroflexi bacterium]|nr:hypothetical protein [Chloroflexota bacterium]
MTSTIPRKTASSARIYGRLLVVAFIVAIFAVACPSEKTPDASSSTNQPSDGGAGSGQAIPTPTPTNAASPTDSLLLPDNSKGVLTTVKGRTLGVNATYWDETSEGGINVQLTYKLWIGIATDPNSTEKVMFRYNVEGPDGYGESYSANGLFDGTSPGNATRGEGGQASAAFSRLHFIPGPGLYTISGAFDDEEFSVDFEAVVPPNRLGAQAPPGTWEPTEVPKSDLAGPFDLTGFWAGLMPVDNQRYPTMASAH